MSTSTVLYQGQLRTQMTHLASGNQVITDAPVDNQGRGEAFSPTDLVATALASCAITIMGIAAQNHGFDLQVTANITKIMAANPRRIGEIRIEFLFTGDYSDQQIRLLEHAARTCPVSLSLSQDLVQSLNFVFE